MSDSTSEHVDLSDEPTLTELKPVKTSPVIDSIDGNHLADVEQKEREMTKMLQQMVIDVVAGKPAGPALNKRFGKYVRAIELLKDLNATKKRDDTRTSEAIVQAYRDLDRDGFYLQKRIESINMELSDEHYPCPPDKESILRIKLAALSERLEHHKKEWDNVPEKVRSLEDENKDYKKVLAYLGRWPEDYISAVTRVLDRVLAKTTAEEATGDSKMTPVLRDRLVELRSQGRLD